MQTTSTAARRPAHVIWITTDHLRYDNLAANGNAEMVTPAMDALARSGVNFHACYTQNSLCMPSRCSFMTGLYPPQTQVTKNGHALPPDFRPTVASAFSAGGYQTAQIGKLHFQPHDNMDFDVTPRHTYGFDVFWPSEERGNYSDAYYHWLEGKYPQYLERFRCPRSTDARRPDSERAPAVIDAPWQASHAGWIVETAIAYLQSRRGARHFMHLGFYNPHPPLTPTREAWELNAARTIAPPRQHPEEWRDKPEPIASMLRRRQDWTPEDFITYRRGFNAMVSELDLALGSLFDQLKELGLWEDTLVILSSDHGDQCGDHGITHKAPHHYDEVMHVPLVLSWPAAFGEKQRDEQQLIEMVDLLPSLLELSGCHVPGVMQGRSFAPQLLAREPVPGRDDVFAYDGDGWAMLRTRTHKYLRYESNGGEVLYDFADPHHEVINHAAEAAYQPTLAALRHRMLGRTLMACRSPLARSHPF